MADGITFEWTCNASPLQAEGTIEGQKFYFRSRYDGWSIGIGGEDPIGSPMWYHWQAWGDGRFGAGYMPKETGEAFIRKAAKMWLERNHIKDEPNAI